MIQKWCKNIDLMSFSTFCILESNLVPCPWAFGRASFRGVASLRALRASRKIKIMMDCQRNNAKIIEFIRSTSTFWWFCITMAGLQGVVLTSTSWGGGISTPHISTKSKNGWQTKIMVKKSSKPYGSVYFSWLLNWNNIYQFRRASSAGERQHRSSPACAHRPLF